MMTIALLARAIMAMMQTTWLMMVEVVAVIEVVVKTNGGCSIWGAIGGGGSEMIASRRI